MEEIKNKITEETFKKMKRHPAYYWNYILLWLFTKGLFSIKVVNRFKWIIK